MMFRKHKRPEEKLAYHLIKGDTLAGPKGEKAKIESVVKKNDDRDVHVTVRTNDGKKVLIFNWRDEVPLWKKPVDRKWRYSFLIWLGKKIDAPVKRV